MIEGGWPRSGPTVHVLGTVRLSAPEGTAPRLPPSLQRLIALLAAAGPAGITRSQLAVELWGDPLPESWKSAMRNRITAARRLLGADSVENSAGRFRFSTQVGIDSWDLINHQTPEGTHELAFLEGEPLMDVTPSPTIDRHITVVGDARAALLQNVVTKHREPLSALALQALRDYQRTHQLDPTICRETVRAFVHAGEVSRANTIVEEIREAMKGTSRRSNAWVDTLDDVLASDSPRRRRDDRAPSAAEAAAVTEAEKRAELFEQAGADGDWNLAFEIAMSGLPNASRMHGDPARLRLLEAIPLPKLNRERQFALSLELTRHLVYASQPQRARVWSMTARELATTPDDQMQAYLSRVIVGDTPDERAPVPLPTGFAEAERESLSARSMQVAVVNHLERAPYEQAQPLVTWFNELGERRNDPYLRWHKLLLASMTHFVAGDFSVAIEAADRAYRYAELFGIVDAEIALLGQLSNAHWVHGGFVNDHVPNDIAVLCHDSMNSDLARAARAARLAAEGDSSAVDIFLRSFDWRSPAFWAFPTLMIGAAYVNDPELKADVLDRIKRRTGTSSIWGTGVLHLGPVDRIVARLVDSPVDKELHAAAAVSVADQQRLPLWRVVTRLDLEAITGTSEHRRQAEELATTPSLQALVADYEPDF